MKTFDIYFSDLNKDAQERLLDSLHVKSASDMNWDVDIFPIISYDVAEDDGEEEEVEDHENYRV